MSAVARLLYGIFAVLAPDFSVRLRFPFRKSRVQPGSGSKTDVEHRLRAGDRLAGLSCVAACWPSKIKIAARITKSPSLVLNGSMLMTKREQIRNCRY